MGSAGPGPASRPASSASPARSPPHQLSALAAEFVPPSHQVRQTGPPPASAVFHHPPPAHGPGRAHAPPRPHVPSPSQAAAAPAPALVRATMHAPVHSHSPIVPPVAVPTAGAVAAPIPVTVAAPVPIPVAAPVPILVAAPVPAPVVAPVPAPVAAPVSAPVSAPVRAAVVAPVPACAPAPAPLPPLRFGTRTHAEWSTLLASPAPTPLPSASPAVAVRRKPSAKSATDSSSSSSASSSPSTSHSASSSSSRERSSARSSRSSRSSFSASSSASGSASSSRSSSPSPSPAPIASQLTSQAPTPSPAAPETAPKPSPVPGPSTAPSAAPSAAPSPVVEVTSSRSSSSSAAVKQPPASPCALPKPPLSWAARVAAPALPSPCPPPRHGKPPHPHPQPQKHVQRQHQSQTDRGGTRPAPRLASGTGAPSVAQSQVRSKVTERSPADGLDRNTGAGDPAFAANGAGSGNGSAARQHGTGGTGEGGHGQQANGVRTAPSGRGTKTTLARLYTSRLKALYESVPLPSMQARGLVNSGNTCFSNVVLQALLAVHPFRRLLLSLRDVVDLPPLTARFVRLAVEMGAIPRKVSDKQVSPSRRRANGVANGHHSNGGREFSRSSHPEPLLPDWFDGVFPCSGSTGGATLGNGGGSGVGAGAGGSGASRSGSGRVAPSGPTLAEASRLPSRQGSQEDAEEYLSFVLNRLHEELLAERPAVDDSALFGTPPALALSLDKSTATSSRPSGKETRGGLAKVGLATNGNGVASPAGTPGASSPGDYMNGHSSSALSDAQKSTDDELDDDGGMGTAAGPSSPATPPKRLSFADVASRGSNKAHPLVTANGSGGVAAGRVEGNGGLADDGSSVTTSVSAGAADEGVWEEMTRKGKVVEVRNAELETSPITEIFGGVFRSSFKRPKAKVSVTREPFLSLSLDIDSGLVVNLEGSLTEYFRPEQLEGYTLEDSSEAVEARKHVQLEQLPQVLILHLKRFSHNMQTGALTKVTRRLDFPEYLQVPHHLLALPKRFPRDCDRMYRLSAAVNHIGKELAGGHYTCDVRRDAVDGKPPLWTTCDDSKVTSCDLQQVLKKQAYLLFYSKEDASSV